MREHESKRVHPHVIPQLNSNWTLSCAHEFFFFAPLLPRADVTLAPIFAYENHTATALRALGGQHLGTGSVDVQMVKEL